ncbi:hypothetical protein AB835_02210 [Candidatus Endobugula sertula]|uniref:FAD-binding domain-containing protein n=1 Tax=Candidatus Endobugula sertula TaxID=62101 RepID=A0A1D2QT96_9GAMM|nr:hypothetical protein AB835_02210 [Candidatus Endobugula sertula]
MVIVGAGLVGASCAALLAKNITPKSDLQIAVIDAGKAPELPSLDEDAPEFDPRVVALTHTSQQLFEKLGVWEVIQSQRACSYTEMRVWDDEGTASIHFRATDIQQRQLGYIVENSVLLCAVSDYIQQQDNIMLLCGVSVESLAQSDSGVVLQCTDGSLLSADLLVAADGGQSKIRELTNISVREWEYEHKAIVATVRSENSHRHTAWQNFLSSGPLAFLPLEHPSEQYCSIVWSVEDEKADWLMGLDEQAFGQELACAFEYCLGSILNVSQRFCFPLVQCHAVDYMSNGVVLIGDAAHTIHPLAGQGVNLGLLDVQALVCELERAIKRDMVIYEPSVLRRYQRQRKGHNLQVMLLMEGLKRLFGNRQLTIRWLRNIGMKKVNEFSLLKNWLAKQAIRNNE